MRSVPLAILVAASCAVTWPNAEAQEASAALLKLLPRQCATLQSQGWAVPEDVKRIKPDIKAELAYGNLMYMCSLGKTLPAAGAGHAPNLGINLSHTSGDPDVIFTAHYWCSADQAATLRALNAAILAFANAAQISVPPALYRAIEAQTAGRWTQAGYAFVSAAVAVDAQACDKVRPGELGAVMMAIDVKISPLRAR